MPSSAQLLVCADPAFPGEKGRGGSLRSGYAPGDSGRSWVSALEQPVLAK